MKNNSLITQTETNIEFLRDLYRKTKDPKQAEQIKREMLDNQQTLTRLKSGV